MARRITAFPKDLPLLNQHMLDFEQLQRKVADLEEQIKALLARLKAANIP